VAAMAGWTSGVVSGGGKEVSEVDCGPNRSQGRLVGVGKWSA
jgi:hypothetical protein